MIDLLQTTQRQRFVELKVHKVFVITEGTRPSLRNLETQNSHWKRGPGEGSSLAG